MFVGLTLLITIVTLVALAVASRLDGRHPADYGFNRSAGWARDFAGGVAIGATAVIITLIYEGIRGRMSLSIETADVGTQSLFVAVVAVAVMFVFFLANNVFEEVVYRGIFITNAAEGLQSRSISRTPTVLIGLAMSAPVFGLTHFLHGPGGIVTSAIAGVLFGVAYVLTGSLGLPIGVHFGGVAYSAITQEQFAGGLTLPSPLVAEPLVEPSLTGTVEAWIVRALAGIGLVCLWVYVFYGEIRIIDRFAAKSS